MDDPTQRPAKPCPICGRKAEPRHRPFCSERCRLIDLGRWLGGNYRIAGAALPEESDLDAPDDP